MVIYVFSTTEAPSPQLPQDAPPDSQVAASIEAAVQMAAVDDEVRLVNGPFVCKPLLFDGKCLVFKGIGELRMLATSCCAHPRFGISLNSLTLWTHCTHCYRA
jgi:hypothetical protein